MLSHFYGYSMLRQGFGEHCLRINSSVSMFERREEAEQRGQEERDYLSKAAFQVHSRKRLS